MYCSYYEYHAWSHWTHLLHINIILPPAGSVGTHVMKQPTSMKMEQYEIDKFDDVIVAKILR